MTTSYLNDLLKSNYKAIIWGGILTCLIFITMYLSGGFIINPTSVISPVYFTVNTLCFLLCWVVIIFFISKFSFYKILGLLCLLFLGSLAQYYIKTTNNPITIPFLILFWMGISYMIIPEIFKKHLTATLISYGAIITYFFIFRENPNYNDKYSVVVAVFLILSISTTFLLWVYQQWKWFVNLKANQSKNELMLLKNQINPHFFFNTLNNLYGLVIEKSEKAPEMILKLSDIMRYTIYDGQQEFVNLDEEIAYLEDYIELSKIRYKKQVTINFNKKLLFPHKIAPILLVIPLENAFKHGIDSLTENAFLDIKISTDKSHIFFTVINNYEVVKRKNKEGIGLENLKQRLAIMYPNKHELKINQTKNIYELNLCLQTM